MVSDVSIGNDVTMRPGDGASLGRIDQYELIRELGGGGFGTVFLAHDTVAGIDVAVKGLPPLVRNNKEELENIRRNFALVSRLHHPHIAAALVLHPVKSVSYAERAIAEKLRVFEGDFLVVMEYAPGVTLSQWRKQFEGGRVPADKACEIVRQVADAIDYAHAEKIIHRDIKPANVMIETKEDGSFVARVLDFGLAAEVRSSMGRVSREIHDTSGTRPYMAPEQWVGEKQGSATDQYALAVLAYELLTGEVPFASVFDCGDPVIMMTAVCNREIKFPVDCPFRGVLLTALAKQPDTRFDSCSEFAFHLMRTFERPAIPVRTADRIGRIRQREAYSFALDEDDMPRMPKHDAAAAAHAGKSPSIMEKMLMVFAFVLIGLVVSFAVYRISPTYYEATGEVTMDVPLRASDNGGDGATAEAMPNYSGIYAEIFNTRFPDWRSEKIVVKIVQQYRAKNPASKVSDEEIIDTLGGAKLELQHNSRIVAITVRSKNPALAAALANAYAEAIESFTDEENKVRCDKAVQSVHNNVEKKRREVDKVAKQLLDFRTANKVDNLRSTRDTVQQTYQKTTTDILSLEAEETQLIEWEKMLTEVQKDPKSYGKLSSGVSRAEEIAKEFRAFQDADGEYQSLIIAYTDKHPEVLSKKKTLDIARQRFLDAAVRALATCRAMLQVNRNKLANLKAKQDDLKDELASVSQRIVLAESGLGQLEAEFEIANDVLKGLILQENEARLVAEQSNEIVRVGRQASVPTNPVLPNPVLIFSVGITLAGLLGLVFVRIVNNLGCDRRGHSVLMRRPFYREVSVV